MNAEMPDAARMPLTLRAAKNARKGRLVSKLLVVPAQAGTHSHDFKWVGIESEKTTNTGIMDPRFRGDDKGQRPNGV